MSELLLIQRLIPHVTSYCNRFLANESHDPIDRVVLVYRSDRLPSEFTGDMLLPCLEEVSLELTVDQMFGWLKVARNP